MLWSISYYFSVGVVLLSLLTLLLSQWLVILIVFYLNYYYYYYLYHSLLLYSLSLLLLLSFIFQRYALMSRKYMYQLKTKKMKKKNIFFSCFRSFILFLFFFYLFIYLISPFPLFFWVWNLPMHTNTSCLEAFSVGYTLLKYIWINMNIYIFSLPGLFACTSLLSWVAAFERWMWNRKCLIKNGIENVW